MTCRLKGRELSVDVTDEGVGIADVEKAMEPLYTTKPEKDSSGMGFTFMEAFMDEVHVQSQVGKGTTAVYYTHLSYRTDPGRSGDHGIWFAHSGEKLSVGILCKSDP